MVYKPCWIHFVLDHLSQIGHGELAIGIKDQLLDVTLFIIHHLSIIQSWFWKIEEKSFKVEKLLYHKEVS